LKEQTSQECLIYCCASKNKKQLVFNKNTGQAEFVKKPNPDIHIVLNGTVCLSFKTNRIDSMIFDRRLTSLDKMDKMIVKWSTLSYEEIRRYGKSKEVNAIWMKDIKVFDKPLALDHYFYKKTRVDCKRCPLYHVPRYVEQEWEDEDGNISEADYKYLQETEKQCCYEEDSDCDTFAYDRYITYPFYNKCPRTHDKVSVAPQNYTIVQDYDPNIYPQKDLPLFAVRPEFVMSIINRIKKCELRTKIPKMLYPFKRSV